MFSLSVRFQCPVSMSSFNVQLDCRSLLCSLRFFPFFYHLFFLSFILTCLFTYLLTNYLLTNSCTLFYLLTHLLTYTPTCLFVHSFTHSITHSLNHSCSWRLNYSAHLLTLSYWLYSQKAVLYTYDVMNIHEHSLFITTHSWLWNLFQLSLSQLSTPGLNTVFRFPQPWFHHN